ncbi:hypothetical protein F5X99DRAFT_278833 [Biscogniauxia marginata]|nr:hypothetical protein F5X99DRAFT_278833 [Biscogniauxia marginata]
MPPSLQSVRQLIDWQVMQRRGRYRIHKASRDPVARAKLLADIPPPVPVKPRLSEADIRSALHPLSAYFSPEPPRFRPPTEHTYTFLIDFSPEIRNMIYEYAVDYPTCRDLFDSYYRQLQAAKSRTHPCNQDEGSSSFKVTRHTPTILLLCKQITLEAMSVLRLRTLVIDRIPPWIMGNPAPLALTDFISRATLQSIPFVEIKLALGVGRYRCGDVWLQLIKEMLDAWSERNSLVQLRIMFKLADVEFRGIWCELEEYDTIKNTIEDFAWRHGAKPNIVTYEHWVLDSQYAYKTGYRNPLIRKHPDPNIWTGSVMEWI